MKEIRSVNARRKFFFTYFGQYFKDIEEKETV
jgi:hypothetical protein